jgi:hypothetical protein
LPNCTASYTIATMTEVDLRPAADASYDSPFRDQLRAPRFGVLDLLIWIAAAAALLGLFATSSDLPTTRPLGPFLWAFRVTQFGQVIIWASALTGSVILIRSRFYTMLGRLQPGHWLIIITTLEVAVFLRTYLSAWPLRHLTSHHADAMQVATALASLLIVAGYVMAFLSLRDTRWWKIFFGVMGLAEIARSIATLLLLVGAFFRSPGSPPAWIGLITLPLAIFPLAAFVMFVVAATLDLSQRVPRDWLHWLGVAIIGFSYLLNAANQVVLFLLLSRLLGR